MGCLYRHMSPQGSTDEWRSYDRLAHGTSYISVASYATSRWRTTEQMSIWSCVPAVFLLEHLKVLLWIYIWLPDSHWVPLSQPRNAPKESGWDILPARLHFYCICLGRQWASSSWVSSGSRLIRVWMKLTVYKICCDAGEHSTDNLCNWKE